MSAHSYHSDLILIYIHSHTSPACSPRGTGPADTPACVPQLSFSLSVPLWLGTQRDSILTPSHPCATTPGEGVALGSCPLTRTALFREPMPWRLHVDARALSSTSPSGSNSFWPRNSGCSYSIQLWTQKPRGHRAGGSAQRLPKGSSPSSPQGHSRALFPGHSPTYQPRITLMEATEAQAEASATSSQTSLPLPWQPGSEKRIT